MEELLHQPKLVSSERLAYPFGWVQMISNQHGISSRSQIGSDEGVVVAAYVYDAKEQYKVVYFALTSAGELTHAWHETEGLLPELFNSPERDIWTSLETLSERGITLPLHDRKGQPAQKGARSFAGHYIGNQGDFALFHDTDFFDGNKPDKLLKVEFRNGQYYGRKAIKLPLPSNNRIYPDSLGNGLQLMAWEGDELLHRQVNLSGEIIANRKLALGEPCHFQIVHADFHGQSTLIAIEGNHLKLVTIEANGVVESERILYTHSSELYNLWEPERLNETTFAVRLNFEEGNGWAVIHQGELQACYLHIESSRYIDIVTNAVIELPAQTMILAELTRCGAEGYCVTVYPAESNKQARGQLFIIYMQLESLV
ncbi:hypothetical protein EBB07_21470 [Paenibacillaceae bacterium]|nr:hypothetical protein EBB07_21470 [Paenibacillaceae bacterium]